MGFIYFEGHVNLRKDLLALFTTLSFIVLVSLYTYIVFKRKYKDFINRYIAFIDLLEEQLKDVQQQNSILERRLQELMRLK